MVKRSRDVKKVRDACDVARQYFFEVSNKLTIEGRYRIPVNRLDSVSAYLTDIDWEWSYSIPQLSIEC